MIWMQRYPTMQHLAIHFGVPVSCIHRIIHKSVKILHAYVVPRYIRWHTMPEWRNLAGTFPEWPKVVAILDGTPFGISKPKGLCNNVYLQFYLFKDIFYGVHDDLCNTNILTVLLEGPIQRLYYRGDRHAFFLNWIVIVDVKGYVILSRAGFLGRTADSTCMW